MAATMSADVANGDLARIGEYTEGFRSGIAVSPNLCYSTAARFFEVPEMQAAMR